jgi:hypothetical protein
LRPESSDVGTTHVARQGDLHVDQGRHDRGLAAPSLTKLNRSKYIERHWHVPDFWGVKRPKSVGTVLFLDEVGQVAIATLA